MNWRFAFVIICILVSLPRLEHGSIQTCIWDCPPAHAGLEMLQPLLLGSACLQGPGSELLLKLSVPSTMAAASARLILFEDDWCRRLEIIFFLNSVNGWNYTCTCTCTRYDWWFRTMKYNWCVWKISVQSNRSACRRFLSVFVILNSFFK